VFQFVLICVPLRVGCFCSAELNVSSNISRFGAARVSNCRRVSLV
jgi:hypothetical protein